MARRDAAALAGLAALGYAMLRKNKGEDVPVEDRTPAAAAPAGASEPDIASMDVPTIPPMGASVAPQQAAGPARQAPVRQAPVRQAPVRQAPVSPTTASPVQVGARSTGRGGATADEIQAYQNRVSGGARSTGQGGPSAAEIQAYQDRVSGGARSTGQGGATADELVEYERRKRLMTPGADAVEGVYPEKILLGGAGTGARAAYQAAKALAPYPMKTLATAGKEGLEAAAKYGPKAGMDVAKSTAKGIESRAAIQASRAERSAAAKAREQKKFDTMMEARKQKRIAEINSQEPSMAANYSRGGKAFDKGGKTKSKKMASGGSAKSSASKRADGIAQRGKTKGRIY